MADKRKGYSPEVARMAIEAYKTKKGSFREIASASGMSTSTLYRLTTGEVAIDDGRVGAKPILSRAAEAGLIKAIVFMNLRGVGMAKEEVFEAAKALAEEEGCTFKGEDGLPTKHWWDGFRKRAVESGTPISHATYHAAVQPLVATPTYVLFFSSFTSEWQNMALTHLETSSILMKLRLCLTQPRSVWL